MDKRINKLRWDERGLLPVVVQDDETERVLMVAYMNGEALTRTLKTGTAHFWSRSRRALWKKGETSGNVQKVREIRVDCDADTLLLRVNPSGPACHTGAISCFFRKASGKGWTPLEHDGNPAGILKRIYRVIEERKKHPRRDSYVSGLFRSGRDKILKKLGEEANETIIASKNRRKREIIHEMADLWFHSLVLLGHHAITPESVFEELQKRLGTSGLKEKASRRKRGRSS